MGHNTYLLRFVNDEDRHTIKRRALSARVTMRQYILDMALYGKVQKRKPK